jgi:nicotinate-nucleotide adenylyltransferase
LARKIGILGGTFNPVHNAHLAIARAARDAFELDEVLFMPSFEPPHVDAKETLDHNQRVEMLELALCGESGFEIDLREIAREGKSYTIDTIREMRAESYDEYYFIIGGDMIEYLPKWREIDELLRLVTFVGSVRPGYEVTNPCGIELFAAPELEISSSEIRRRVIAGESIDGLVPDKVKDFIYEHRLYNA